LVFLKRSLPMPWQEVSTMQLRTEFVVLAEQGGYIRQLCRRFGISPTTAYKWLERHRQGTSLEEHSRRPLHSPTRSSEAIEAAIVALRQAHPAWGARKLRRRLMELGQAMPSASTVHAILARHGCIRPEASAAAKPYIRFEHPAPNDLWQMDFKGHFALGAARCHPLTVLDDHSRYSLCLAACTEESGPTVRAHLIATFRRYGLPQRMSMDNGPPWGEADVAYTAFDVWLMKQGIRVGHSRPRHPQTQGKDERFHRTLKAELLQARTFEHLAGAQHAFDLWRSLYNHERPHQALGLDTPDRHYHASTTEYRERPPQPEYANPARVRRVCEGGRISWKTHTYRVGKAFVGEPVELRHSTDERYLDVYWSIHRIARIDLAQHTSVHGRSLP
jgi:transposase InsO family protein